MRSHRTPSIEGKRGRDVKGCEGKDRREVGRETGMGGYRKEGEARGGKGNGGKGRRGRGGDRKRGRGRRDGREMEERKRAMERNGRG